MTLFLGKAYLSAITLAGAASGILTQLVLNAGKEPFVDLQPHVPKLALRPGDPWARELQPIHQ